MRIIRGLENYKKHQPLALALGNFDGLHLGHQKLIRENINHARARKCTAAAMIFEPHPLRVLFPERAPRLLISTARKIELFAVLGLEMVIQVPFTRDVARLSPEYFVENVLCDTLGVESVSVGFNFTFGHKGAGTPETLQQLGPEKGFAVQVIPPVKVGDEVVSSTLIRQALEVGDIKRASRFLGHLPMLEGRVVQGEKRGTTIGYPTANVAVPSDLIVPGNGVYAARIKLSGETYSAVVNIGRKPTFHEDYPVSIEAHIFDFDKNIYGKQIRLYFLDKIRDEKKFDGIEQLVSQINDDAVRARKIAASVGFQELL